MIVLVIILHNNIIGYNLAIVGKMLTLDILVCPATRQPGNPAAHTHAASATMRLH